MRKPIEALVWSLAVIAIGTAGHAATETKTAKTDSTKTDSAMTIPGGAEGKNLESITVQGEDRVRVQFDRPDLDLALDPTSAPGLDWNSTWTVLAPESFDFTGPLYARSVTERAPHAPEPWLDSFRDGPVARFTPNVSGVASWSLEVADSRGSDVAHFKGDGKPPKEITWDGRRADGNLARTDLTYSYVLNAMDKAGNKRSFVGNAFEIPPHMDQKGSDVTMTFAVPVNETSVPQALVNEAASRINESGSATRPVRVEVTAPTLSLSKSIASGIVSSLQPLLRGDQSRLSTATLVDAGGGERASVVIRTGNAPAPKAPAGKTSAKTSTKKK